MCHRPICELGNAQFKMTIGIINQKARDKAYFGEILP
jgi:hypothetical protein